MDGAGRSTRAAAAAGGDAGGGASSSSNTSRRGGEEGEGGNGAAAAAAALLSSEAAKRNLDAASDADEEGEREAVCGLLTNVELALRNLGSALSCPICSTSFSRQSDVATLPCLHHFCRDCLTRALRNRPNCPTCNERLAGASAGAGRRGGSTRRSVYEVKESRLSECVDAYKQLLVQFGLAPVEYNADVCLTQYQPAAGVDDCDGADSSLDLVRVHESLQLSRLMNQVHKHRQQKQNQQHKGMAATRPGTRSTKLPSTAAASTAAAAAKAAGAASNTSGMDFARRQQELVVRSNMQSLKRAVTASSPVDPRKLQAGLAAARAFASSRARQQQRNANTSSSKMANGNLRPPTYPTAGGQRLPPLREVGPRGDADEEYEEAEGGENSTAFCSARQEESQLNPAQRQIVDASVAAPADLPKAIATTPVEGPQQQQQLQEQQSFVASQLTFDGDEEEDDGVEDGDKKMPAAPPQLQSQQPASSSQAHAGEGVKHPAFAGEDKTDRESSSRAFAQGGGNIDSNSRRSSGVFAEEKGGHHAESPFHCSSSPIRHRESDAVGGGNSDRGAECERRCEAEEEADPAAARLRGEREDRSGRGSNSNSGAGSSSITPLMRTSTTARCFQDLHGAVDPKMPEDDAALLAASAGRGHPWRFAPTGTRARETYAAAATASQEAAVVTEIRPIRSAGSAGTGNPPVPSAQQGPAATATTLVRSNRGDKNSRRGSTPWATSRMTSASTTPTPFAAFHQGGETNQPPSNSTGGYSGTATKSPAICPPATASANVNAGEVGHTSTATPAASASSIPPGLAVGSLVQVASRTWPGINKPGGVGRVTAVHYDGSKRALTYDVKYVLGGKESKVEAPYVSIEETLNGDDENSSTNRHVDSQGGSKRVKSRRLAKTQPAPATDGIPVELLAQLAREGFDTTGQAAAVFPSRPRQATEAASGRSKSNKRKRGDTSDTTAASREKSSSGAVVTTSFASNEAKCQDADAQYRERIREALKKKVVHVVASGLTDCESDNLQNLILLSKKQKNKVQLKLSGSVQPKKTTLCLARSDPLSAGQPDLKAHSRRLKTMLAALNGIPIVSSSWIQRCLENHGVVEPDESLFIRSLPHSGPSGQDRGSSFGVAQLAASIRQNPTFKPLEGVSICLCGSLAPNKRADLLALLPAAGAKNLSNPSALVAQLKKKEPHRRFVLLICGNQAKLTAAVETQVRENSADGNVIVVNSMWLFDSIGAGQHQGAAAYCPEGSATIKQLWQLTSASE